MHLAIKNNIMHLLNPARVLTAKHCVRFKSCAQSKLHPSNVSIQQKLIKLVRARETSLSEHDQNFLQQTFFDANNRPRRLGPNMQVQLIRTARKYKLWHEGVICLQQYSSPAHNIAGLVTCSGFLAELCTYQFFDYNDPQFDKKIIVQLTEKLFAEYKKSALPPYLGNAIEASLNYAATVLDLPYAQKPEPEWLTINCKMADSRYFIACTYLELASTASETERYEYFHSFKQHFPTKKHLILEHAHIFGKLLDAITQKPVHYSLRYEFTMWLYTMLESYQEPVPGTFYSIMKLLNRELGVNVGAVNVSNEGVISSTSPIYHVSKNFKLPKQDIDLQSIAKCRLNLSTMVEKLAENHGTVTSIEAQRAKDAIAEIRKNVPDNARVLCVDTLNLAFANRKFDVNKIMPFLDILRQDFDVVLLVTRNYTSKYLSQLKLKFKFAHLIYAKNNTEDDVLLLLAAAEYGKNAWIVSKDRFGQYIQKVQELCGNEAAETLADWINRRSIRITPPGAVDMTPNEVHPAIEELIQWRDQTRVREP